MNPADLAEQSTWLIALLVRYTPPLIGAFLVLFAGWTVSNWLRRFVAGALAKTKIDQTLQPLIASVVRYVALGLTVMVVLQQFGVETTSLIALLGTIGLAIGLALQGTLSNVAAGLMLLFLRPFQVGDYVSAGGAEGTVLGIDLFHTNLRTEAGVDLMIPNGAILSGNISNMSTFPERIVALNIPLDVGIDLGKALSVARDVVASHPRVQHDKPVTVATRSIGAGGVEIGVRAWSANEDYVAVRGDLLLGLKERFQAEGLMGPPPAA
jgi:small conductance mechanosensitive channel